MATLEQRVAALEAILSGDVYQSAFDGAVIDSSVGRAKTGGELDLKISELGGKILSHAERHSSSGSDPVSPSSIGAAYAVHAAQHSASGSDPVTPAAIGAVKKSGDSMTGNLSITGSSYPKLTILDTANGSNAQFQHANHIVQIIATEAGSTSNSRQIILSDAVNKSSLRDALRLVETKDGAQTSYNILHTGNLSDLGLPRISMVQYTGTGKTSVSVAIGFVPKLIVIQEVLSVSSSGSPATLPLIFTGVGQALGLYRNDNSGDLAGFDIKVTAFGETVSWSGTDHVEVNNNLNTTYRVTAIG